MIRLRDLIKTRPGSWLLALSLGAVTLFAVVSLLAISGWFITAAALAGLTSAAAAHTFDIFRPSALIRLAAVVRTGGRYAERLASHHAALGLLQDLRCKVFAALAGIRQSLARRASVSSARALHRLVSDIDQLDNFPLRVIAPWCWASVMTLIVLYFFHLLSPALAWMTAPGLVLAWLLLPLATFLRGVHLARRESDLSETRREALVEPLMLMTPLLLWQQWSARHQQFTRIDQAWQRQQFRQQGLGSLTACLQQWLLAVTLLLLLWQSRGLIAAGELTVPWALAAGLTLLAMNEVLAPLCNSFIALGFSQAARDRLNALTRETQEEQETATRPEPQGPFYWQADALTARFEGALSGPMEVSFSLRSGDVLLIEGPSGSGKSTLLQALAGQLPRQSGQLQLNGQSQDHWDTTNTLGWLGQQIDTFDLTLQQNLLIARPEATEAELWQLLDDVALGDWAREQPEGLKTTTGEYGLRLSGGQARRLALARLLLTDRPLLLLDEPFAGLDPATRQQVADALIRRQRQGIVIIVSHQPVDIPGAKRLRIG